MFLAYAIVGGLFGLANINSAVAKIRGVERVTGVLSAAGVPRSWFVPLALLNIAGGLGLLIGILWRPLGVAAAVGLVLYYAGAVITHARVRDVKGMPLPAVLLAFAAVTLALAVASA
ncbi:hypothetical protein L3i22_072200 [Actinoplanes sp. L3-i22]|nr:hypothetical protein L3i22_072200 [Actinoplanes sp. L3-i22]